MDKFQIVSDPFTLAQTAARCFVSFAAEAITRQGHFSVALAGGSTPQELYHLLVQPTFIEQVEWSKVHLFWGDERCVPADHPDSNYGMSRRIMLGNLQIPQVNIHRILGEQLPEKAAQAYEHELRSFFKVKGPPRLDLVLLGMGEDGHTASLFPGSPALGEQSAWVVAVEHQVPPPPLVSRITLTLTVINAAAHVLFLVSGSIKANCLFQVYSGVSTPPFLPAQLVNPMNGELLWLVDHDAAKFLPNLNQT